MNLLRIFSLAGLILIKRELADTLLELNGNSSIGEITAKINETVNMWKIFTIIWTGFPK